MDKIFTDKKRNILYVAGAYFLLWGVVLLAIIGKSFVSEDIIFPIATLIGSWTPTIVLFILFKKLLPNDTIKSFYKNVFKEKINWKIILFVSIVQLSIMICSAVILSYAKSIYLSNIIGFSLPAILMGLIISIITGATGEESGWRGFLQTSIEKKLSVIKTSLIIGIIWSFWHIPMWYIEFKAGDFTLIQYLHYIITFIVLIISTSVIIGICYNICRNLFIPVWIHFMFNFSISLVIGSSTAAMDDLLLLFTFGAIIYVFAAIGYIVWNKKRTLCLEK